MNANELRTGNLVKINNDLLVGTKGEIYKVSGFNARLDLSFPDSTGTISLDHTKSIRTYSQFDEFIDPIELTPEWLKNLDFINREKGNFSFNQNMSLRIVGDEYDYNGLWIGQIQYVHQLQNLYFALTGVELQLTAPILNVMA